MLFTLFTLAQLLVTLYIYDFVIKFVSIPNDLDYIKLSLLKIVQKHQNK